MSVLSVLSSLVFFFFFNDTATTEIYTLSLHDALPICYAICYHCAWSGEMAGKDDGTPNRVWVLMRYDKGEKVRSTGVFETAKDANARAKGERKRGIKCKVVKFRRDV